MRATGVGIAGVTVLAASRCTSCEMRRPIGMHSVQAHDMAVNTREGVTGIVMTAAMTEAIVMSVANIGSTGAGIVVTKAIKVTKAMDTGEVMAGGMVGTMID